MNNVKYYQRIILHLFSLLSVHNQCVEGRIWFLYWIWLPYKLDWCIFGYVPPTNTTHSLRMCGITSLVIGIFGKCAYGTLFAWILWSASSGGAGGNYSFKGLDDVETQNISENILGTGSSKSISCLWYPYSQTINAVVEIAHRHCVPFLAYVFDHPTGSYATSGSTLLVDCSQTRIGPSAGTKIQPARDPYIQQRKMHLS